MHGTLKDRLEAAESPIQQEVSLGGHLNFVCGLRGSYGARCVGVSRNDFPVPEKAELLSAARARSGNVTGSGCVRRTIRSSGVIMHLTQSYGW